MTEPLRQDATPDEIELLQESRRIFKNLVLGMAALFILLASSMVWVLSEPDTYHEHLAAQPPGTTSPDGSVVAPNAQPGG
jgi:hypothetical protein